MVILDPPVSSSTSRFELHQVNSSTWLIWNHSIPPTDPAHVVADVTAGAVSGVDVLWRVPTGLPTHYLSAGAAIDDLRQRDRHRSRRVRPVPIPHLPPTNPHRR